MTMNYFKNTPCFIEDNIALRKPQRLAYKALKKAFENNDDHKLVVLPTGTGKTGLMGITPFGIADGRVLIITPSLVIREGISDEFDTRTQFNFWTERNVIFDDNYLPKVYRYAGHNGTAGDKKRVKKYLTEAQIVIANIHKVYNTTSKKVLTKMLEPDFFDMIIIDEAHHSAADSWLETLKHFNAKKIVKLTATPTRNDLKEITGELVYEYSMAEAISNEYIKNVVTDDYTTEHLQFEVDGKLVSKDEAIEIMDKNWVSRSVAYSLDCSKTIVDMSIKKLQEKRENGEAFHQIIAVACGVNHAKQIVQLYQESGYSADYITSDRPTEENEKVIIEYKKGQIDVLVNVNMLGEGFDHPPISIAAIFRPFRSLPPYAQFIGRTLRRINTGNQIDSIDNLAHVVYHKELDLDELWSYYAGEEEKAVIRRKVECDVREFTPRKSEIGDIVTGGSVLNTTKEFLKDGASNSYKEELQNIINTRIKKIKEDSSKMRAAGISEEDILEFERMKLQETGKSIDTKRDQLREELIREELHEAHQDHIASLVSNLLLDTGLDPKGIELPSNTSSPFLKNSSTNDAYIMMYIHHNLKQKIKRGIDEWEVYDFKIAEEHLPAIIERLYKKIEGTV